MSTSPHAARCPRHLVLIAAFLTLVSPQVTRVASQGIPQSQLEAEFREAAQAAIPIAESLAGNAPAFLEAVQPYGPLDLIVLHATSGAHASQLRSFFLGVVGGAARIDPAPFANQWHCGPQCAVARRDSLVQRLSEVQNLVDRFRLISGVDVIATWPANGYRAGRVTYDGHTWRLSSSSPGMGFMPWRTVTVTDSGATEFRTLGTDRRVVEALVAAMRSARIVALAREPSGGIRAVLHGAISDNEAGLLFMTPGVAPPSFQGLELPDGRKYVGGEKVASEVYFYVTT